MSPFFCIFDVSDPCRMELEHLCHTLKEAVDTVETLMLEHPENEYRVMKISDVQASDWPDADGIDLIASPQTSGDRTASAPRCSSRYGN
jgi:hypothetical protein